MSTIQLLSKSERNRLRAVLREWRVPRRAIEDVLRHGVFVPGTIGMHGEGLGLGLGIMVDEDRDPELAGLFDRRAGLQDDAFLAEWETGARPHAHVFFCPSAPEALFAYTVNVIRPIALTRTYLVLVSKQARILSFLRQPGTTIWLVPQAMAWREWAKEGTGTGHDLYSRALPVGIVTTTPAGLTAALEHVGFADS